MKLQQISDAPTAHISSDVTERTRRIRWRCECDTTHSASEPWCDICGKHRPPQTEQVHPTAHHAGSQIPEGVRQRATIDRLGEAPSKQFSLWGHYSVRVQRALEARNTPELVKLAACARRDYDAYRGYRRLRQEPSAEAQVTELMRDYSGWRSLEAAWMLNAPERWVRRQRVLNGRDPEFGHPFKGDNLTLKIAQLSARGMTERQIATITSLGRATVHRRLVGAVTPPTDDYREIESAI